MSWPTEGIDAWMGSLVQQAIASGGITSSILDQVDVAGVARQTETLKLSLATAVVPSLRETNLAAVRHATAAIDSDALRRQIQGVLAASRPVVDFSWIAADMQAPMRALARSLAQQNASTTFAVDRLLSSAALSIVTSGLGPSLRRYETVTKGAAARTGDRLVRQPGWPLWA